MGILEIVVMLEKVAKELAEKLSPEVVYTAIALNEEFGTMLNVEQYATLMRISPQRVTQQISDETVDVIPVKIGRNNMFSAIEIAKVLHKPRAA